MGILNDVIGIARDFTHIGDDLVGDTITKKRFSSISRRSMEGTLQFPTLVSRSLDIDTLQMINKALERQYASFTQVALTMNPFLHLDRERDASGYIRKFHQNMGKSNVKDDFFNLLAYTDVKESYDVYTDNESIVVLTAIGEGVTSEMVISNREGLTDIMEGMLTDTINSLHVPPLRQVGFNDYNLRRKHSQEPVFENKQIGVLNRGTMNTVERQELKTNGDYMNIKDASITQNITQNIRGGSRGITASDTMVDQKLPNRVLQDNDVKKSNELIPTTMHVRTMLMNKEGQNQGNLDFIVGVKATMHPVTSEEMVENIFNGIKKQGSFFKFIRWTTGEIQFARDYLMNLTEIKEDAARTSRKDSRWWTALKRRRKLSKFKRTVFLPGDILPNTSIVLSIEEAEFIKREYGFDIQDPRIAYKIMNEYFLIGMVIVDAGAQVAHFLFDGNEDYQTVTFSGLERGDISGGGVDFKDVLKLVQRV